LPDVKDKLAGVGAEPAGNSPEEFAAFIRSETEKWGRVIRTGKISLESGRNGVPWISRQWRNARK
jgi:hypothetical protein